jgi:hypothetical protein
MKFTIERAALVKMLEVIGRKAPSKKWRDKEVRLSACAPRVFVEANESTGGVEALVFEDGTCLLSHKTFLKLLKTHFPNKNITVEADEHKIKRVRETDFGPRYEVEGSLKTPDGREPFIRSVWQFDKGEVAPRLITAYPLEAR